jgi:DNA gyrase subunit A
VASFNRQGRGGQGVRGMRINESRGSVVAAFTVDSGMEVLVFSSAGNIVRMGVDEISEQGRDATGVRVARLDEGDTVVAVAPVLEADNDESAPDDGSVSDGPVGEDSVVGDGVVSDGVAPDGAEGEEI